MLSPQILAVHNTYKLWIGPIKANGSIIKLLSLIQVPEHLPQKVVIRLIVELQAPGVVHKDGELLGEVLAELLG